MTACIQRGLCLLGEVEDGKMCLSPAGEMVTDVWSSLERELDFVRIGDFVVMPNHLHGVIWLIGLNSEGAHGVRPYDDVEMGTTIGGIQPRSLGLAIQRFKSITTSRYAIEVRRSRWQPFPGRLWQRNYFEHVVRDERDLARIRAYIASNPARWTEDPLRPTNT